MIKVLFCGLKYDYGRPERGLSFEYKNIYDSLRHMPGVEAELFAMDEKIMEVGRDAVNAQLIYEVEQKRPDLLFCFLFTEEIKKQTIAHITQKTTTKTFNWFADDHWRFPVYSRQWAPLFTLVSTTDKKAFQKYQSAGITNVVKTQWAANTFLYHPQDPSRNVGKYDITFLGQNYGKRGQYLATLLAAGLKAEGFGRGWPHNNQSGVEEMLDIYSFSKISLNFSETPYYGFKKKMNLLAKLFVKKELGQYRFNGQNFLRNLESGWGTQRRTIKARPFEIAACGGFLLTGVADDPIEDYFVPGQEIATFKNTAELVAQSRFYLQHEPERSAIARAGYRRVLKDHTYPNRFEEIFKRLELKLE